MYRKVASNHIVKSSAQMTTNLLTRTARHRQHVASEAGNRMRQCNCLGRTGSRSGGADRTLAVAVAAPDVKDPRARGCHGVIGVRLSRENVWSNKGFDLKQNE